MTQTASTQQGLDRDFYGSPEYLRDGRLYSLAHQLQAALDMAPRTILEVGVGSGVFAAAARAAGVRVTTLDIEPTLAPDLLAPVTRIPTGDGAFDVGVCCQVLEHIPFEEVGDALRELRRVLRVGLVLSLPDVTPHFELSIALPKLGRHRLSWSPPPLVRRRFPRGKLEKMGHHWEIGFRGYGLRRVLAVCRGAGWRVDRTWRVPEKAWHRFFTLRP